MIPGFVGLKVTVSLPFLPVFTVFAMPGPVILTVTPATGFLPFLTVILIFCDLPFPFRTFGVTVIVSQISGTTTGGFGGVTGAVTIVEAEAVLLVVLVSGVVVVTITTFVFVPVAFTVALTVMATDAPGARL